MTCFISLLEYRDNKCIASPMGLFLLEALHRATKYLTAVLCHFNHLYRWYFPPPNSTNK